VFIPHPIGRPGTSDESDTSPEHVPDSADRSADLHTNNSPHFWNKEDTAAHNVLGYTRLVFSIKQPGYLLKTRQAISTKRTGNTAPAPSYISNLKVTRNSD